MSNSNKFSVLMCVYEFDDSYFFKQALDSVFNQSVIPNEVVLVVDGPIPKKTNNFINDFLRKEKKLKTIKLNKNVGHGKAKNIGLNECLYELVAIMDSDDICCYDRFEKQLSCFANNPNLSIVGGGICEFENTIDNKFGKRILPTSHSDISKYLKSRCPMNHMTVMFKKSEVVKAGGYLDWHYNEDYYLWIRMYLEGSVFANLDNIVVYARVGENFYLRRGGYSYFISEAKLQYFMFKNNIIGIGRLYFNILIRLFIQVLIPNKLRAWIFINFFRNK
tara:strand:+ start:5702 stop:6532 length:831 start_codon:yes stop_codon:yes gene_type:complete